MRVQEVMTRSPETLRFGSTLREAADLMQKLDVGVLPVSDGNHHVVALVTDRDIVVRGVSRGYDPDTHRVEEVATRDVVTCTEDQDVYEVASLMKERKIRRIPVVNGSEDLVGMVSLGDLARSLEHEQSGDVLEQISRPSR